MFHLRGTMFHIRGAERYTYWNRAFHVLGLCVPYTGTVRSMYWNCVFQSMELCWNTASAADEVGIGRVSLRVVPRL